MSQGKTVESRYTFDSPTYVKFLDRTDFTMAKYHDISLEGFSTFCNRPLEIGERMRVETNLKMISGGLIDDIDPHFAICEVTGQESVNGKTVHRFKFVEFKSNTYNNLSKAIDYLEQKEKLMTLSDISTENLDAQSTIGEIVKDMTERIIKGQVSLPVLPKIVREIEEVTKNPEATNDDIAKVIEKDAVIAVKVISTANSPYYRGVSHIVTVRETIPRLGIKETQNLVLSIATKSLYHAKNQQFMSLLEQLWCHSLACAMNAKAIAKAISLEDADKYFTMGLIHDVGQTVLLKILGEMSGQKSFETEDIENSIEKHGTKLGEVILKHWQFSDEFVDTVVRHKMNAYDENTPHSILVIHIANQMTYNIGYGTRKGDVDLNTLDAVKLLGVSPLTLTEINDTTKRTIEESRRAF